MKRRILFLAVSGVACLLAAFVTTRVFIQRSRPQTNAEWRAELSAKDRAERNAKYHREMKEAIAGAKTSKERELLEYDYRIACYGEQHGEISSLFQPVDGVDHFEAYLLANVYRLQIGGVCSGIDLPVRGGEDWVVAFSIGRNGKPGPAILINAKTGSLRCEGHPTVTDPKALLVQWDRSFQPAN